MSKSISVRFSCYELEKIEFIKEKLNYQSISSVVRHCIDKEYERLNHE